MADLNHLISLGIGSPAAIQEFLTFGLQQGVADTTPDAFSFVDQTNVSLNATITSAAITVAGINNPAAISVVGGTYSINGGAFTAVPGNVNNGDTVTARHTSSGSLATATNTLVTIGGVSDTFTSTTIAVLPVVADTSGGFYPDFEAHLRKRRKRQKELEEAEEEQQRIKDAQAREIARFLQEQERQDAERKDIERIRALVREYKGPIDTDSERLSRALKAAQDKQTKANLERLQREFERSQEEEDLLALLLMLAND